ncbi:DEAD-box ATP-dependent RNA helicase CshA-like [Halichondria panicea]|uniref:DEAD-box ATP-dependent RNA helicase CshA-like n=1 Tax=Halichondria panicea TaxID=6063 RepID=UPI00312BC3AC
MAQHLAKRSLALVLSQALKTTRTDRITAYRLKWSHGLPLISRPGWMSPRYYVTDVRPVMTEWEGGDKTPPPIEEVSVGKEKAVLEGAFTGKLFSELSVNPDLLGRLQRLGIERAFEVQDKTLPLTLEGRDVIGRAITGSGKTLAFALPIVQVLSRSAAGRHPRALVITPTRELCNQVAKSVQQLSQGLRCLAVYGGDSIHRQAQQLRKGVDVVCATPGRLNDHITRGAMSLSEIQFLVLDEADELLTPGFLAQIRNVLNGCPQGKQMMLFSATIPEHIMRIAEEYMRDPVTVDLVTDRSVVPDSVVHNVVRVTSDYKHSIVAALLTEHKPRRAIVFNSSRAGTGHLSRYLRTRGVRAAPINSDLSQRDREYCLANFRQGKIDVLCATDVAARGIDVPETDLVIQVGPPPSGIDFYIHRSGRTGRKGQIGQSILVLVDGDNSSKFTIDPDDFLRQMRSHGIPFRLLPPPTELMKERVLVEWEKLLSVGDEGVEAVKPHMEKLLAGKNSDELVVAAIALLTGAAKSTSDVGGVRKWKGNSSADRSRFRGQGSGSYPRRDNFAKKFEVYPKRDGWSKDQRSYRKGDAYENDFSGQFTGVKTDRNNYELKSQNSYSNRPVQSIDFQTD